jgi:ankyrin repeat protein
MNAVMANDNLALVEKLIKAGADVNERDASGETALMNARYSNNPAIIKHSSMPCKNKRFDNQNESLLMKQYRKGRK